jgi:radical SAM protein with 4Fe4S-binding SPASM domain
MSQCSNTCNWGSEFDASLIKEAIRENKLLALTFELDESNPYRTDVGEDAIDRADPLLLTYEEWKDIVNQGLELGIKRIILKGKGEPLNRDWTLDLIRHIRSSKCEVDLFTSGHLVSRVLAEQLFDLGIHVVLKLDAFDSAKKSILLVQAQQLPGSFSGLNNLMEAGYPGTANMLGIEVVVTRLNIDNIPELWRWARQNSIFPIVRRSSATGQRGKNEETEIPIKELQDLFERLSKIDREEFQKLWIPHPPQAGLESLCIQYSLSFTASGSVKPCLAMDLSIGDIRKTPLKSIVGQSTVFKQLRGIGSHIIGYCRKCRLTDKCFGCRAAAYNFSGNFLESDPYCWNRRLIDDDFKKANVSDELPHKVEMKLIGGTAFVDKKKIKIDVTVPPDSIFVSPGGRLNPIALVEMLAQLCAVQQAYEKNSNQGQNLCGYLVGMDNVRFMNPVFAGEKLDLTAWKNFEMEAIHKVEGEIFRGETAIGQAELTLYEAEEWQALPEIFESDRMEAGVVSADEYPWIDKKDRVGREILQSVCRLSGQSEESIEATLFFRPNFVCFSGHFPDYPVLPAIVFVYAGWMLAEITGHAELDLACVKKGKFLRPVHPFDHLDFELRQLKKKSENMIWYSVSVKCQNEVAAKYDLGLVAIGEGK